MSQNKRALIVGASRGLGLAIVTELVTRGWNVTGTVRQAKDTQLHSLQAQNKKEVSIETLDMNSISEIQALQKRLHDQKFDLLFVNAGVANEKGMSETIGEVSSDEFSRVLSTNALAPMRVVEALKGLVLKDGVIGIMSSGQGSITDNVRGGNDVYRASKAALNMLMRSFAARSCQDQALLLLAPGWIKTDMGGSGASFTIEETIGEIVNTITAQAGKRGLSYLDRFAKTVNW